MRSCILNFKKTIRENKKKNREKETKRKQLGLLLETEKRNRTPQTKRSYVRNGIP